MTNTHPTTQPTTTFQTPGAAHERPRVRIWAVDARNHFYRLVAQRHDKVLLEGASARQIGIHAALEAATRFVGEVPDALPIYILDGPAPAAKKAALQARRETREAAKEHATRLAQEARELASTIRPGEPAEAAKRAQVATLDHEARKSARRAVHLTADDHEAIARALQEAGFPVCHAPGEAETQAAIWCRNGHAWTAATRDMDTVLHGAQRVSRHWPQSNGWQALRGTEAQPGFLEVTGARDATELMEAYVVAGMTDYADPLLPGGARGEGLPRALEALRKEGFEQLVREHAPNPEPWFAARRIYQEPVADADLSRVEWGFPSLLSPTSSGAMA